MLPEEWCRVEAVQVHAVWDFEEVELFFLREDFVDVGFEARVGFEDFGADAALGGGLDLLVLQLECVVLRTWDGMAKVP